MTSEDPAAPGEDNDPADVDEIDLLSLWRSVPVNKLDRGIVRRLSGALIELARSLDDLGNVEPLLLRAQARAVSAWIELADRFLAAAWDRQLADGIARRDNLDRHASCLLIAAHHGSRWASSLLVLHLCQRGPDDGSFEARIAVLFSLGRRYDLSAADPVVVIEDLGVADGVEAYVERKLALRPPPPETKKPAPKSTPEPVRKIEGPAMRVLLDHLEPSEDRERKALIERYGVLRHPVPLTAMPNPDVLAAALLAEFPWATEVVEAINVEMHLVRRLSGEVFRLPPMLLTGAPGVGKSTFARRFCALANLRSATVFAGGSTDNRSLAGTARGWSSSTPSYPLVVMRRFMTSNLVIMVEEIDKAGGSDSNGDLAHTLTAMLDPTLHRSWVDECLQVAVDLSQVNWILTANRLDRVSSALRARCRIVYFPRPRPKDFDVLLAGIVRDLAEEYEVDASLLPELGKDTIDELRGGFRAGRLQARQLANLIRRLLAMEAVAEQACLHH